MPIYENRCNAENHLRFTQERLLDIVCGCDAGAEKIAGTVKNKSVILCEAWYGTPVREFAGILSEKLTSSGKKVQLIPASVCFKNQAEISAMKQVWITEEPAFGRVNEGNRWKITFLKRRYQKWKKRLLRQSKLAKSLSFMVPEPLLSMFPEQMCS